jgi:uncharacterized protein (TIGR00106 family)
MAVAEISIEPIGTGSTSYSDVVTNTVAVLQNEPGLKFDVTAMGTILEGERHQIFAAAERMEEACLQSGAERCLLTVRLDERKDKPMSKSKMEKKVEDQLGHDQGASEDYAVGI